LCYCAKNEVSPPHKTGKTVRCGVKMVTRILRGKPPFSRFNSAHQHEQKQGWHNRLVRRHCSQFEPRSLRLGRLDVDSRGCEHNRSTRSWTGFLLHQPQHSRPILCLLFRLMATIFADSVACPKCVLEG